MASLEQRVEAGKTASESIQDIRMSTLESAGASFKKIAIELCSIAFSRIDDYMTVAEGGEIQAIPLNQIKKKKLAAVRKLKEKTVITESKDGETIYKTSQVEYELYDKVDVLKYLCKLRGDEPADKHVFPDKAGKPQDVSALGAVEAAARIAFVISEVMKRKNGNGGTED